MRLAMVRGAMGQSSRNGRGFGRAGVAAGAAALLPGAVAAEALLPELPVIGQPIPGGTGFQPPVTSLARDLIWLESMLMVILTVITIFVLGLLLYVMVRFNNRSNPTPARFTHNSPLEVTWTVVPIIILVFIGVFSLPILFKQQIMPDADITIKVTGKQWYWTYEYVDHDFEFDSFMIGSPATGGDFTLTAETEAQLIEAGYAREHFLLATDTAMVVPTGATVVVQVTASDVIHAWTIPSFGVKQDGIPGRLAELWFQAEQEGIYFGQCSELCGIAHAYMPITVKVVSPEDYEGWLDRAIATYGGTPRNADLAAAN